MNSNGISFLDCTVKMPLMSLPVRSTVIEIGSSKILISPGSKLTGADYAGLKGVTDIVAPSHFHAGGVPLALRHFPKARVWAAPGLRTVKPEIPWTDDLTPEKWPYGNELSMHHLKGAPSIEEVAFYHRASKSLIVADLAFNIRQASGLGAKIILYLFKTNKGFAISTFFAGRVKDREAFTKSLNEILALDFQNIVVGHGDVLEIDAKTRLARTARDRGFEVRA